VTLTLEFTEAVFGVQKDVSIRTAVACVDCEGTGAAPGSGPETCPDCGGAGQLRKVRQSFLGQMVTSGPCIRCGGLGQVIPNPCPTCSGEGRVVEERSYTVEIPGGVDSGTTLRLSGRGAVGPRGGGAGDLYVHVAVEPHEHLVRQGADLFHRLAIPLTQATLGAVVPYATLDGEERLTIPRGMQTGHTIRLRGQGVPLVQGRGRGDLIVELVVETPDDLSDEQEELVRKLAELRGETVAEPEKGFFARLRSAMR
jgi:molecular chaperone DnaJ